MEEKKVLERLERQCARAEYCSADIRRKALRALEGDEAAAGRVLESLVKDRYVDDARYAGAFTREKSSLSGWGARKIAFALRSKGIAAEIISEALSEISPEQSSKKLHKVLSDKYKTLKNDPSAFAKLMRFGLSRGYSYDEVAEAAKSILSRT
ncbi:MAG: RecX family transcriptional regulator [Bacteroidales bacterium]|nr:RecX family transcriptional regulator [Bacteroidales bacterium]